MEPVQVVPTRSCAIDLEIKLGSWRLVRAMRKPPRTQRTATVAPIPAHRIGNQERGVNCDSTGSAGAAALSDVTSVFNGVLVESESLAAPLFVAVVVVATKSLVAGFTMPEVLAREIEFVGRGRAGGKAIFVESAGALSIPAVDVMA